MHGAYRHSPRQRRPQMVHWAVNLLVTCALVPLQGCHAQHDSWVRALPPLHSGSSLGCTASVPWRYCWHQWQVWHEASQEWVPGAARAPGSLNADSSCSPRSASERGARARAWLYDPPNPMKLRTELGVRVLPSFFTEAVAVHVVELARASAAMGPAAQFGRTSDVIWLGHNTSPVVENLTARVAKAVGLNRSHAENLQVVRYPTGGQYRRHFDAFSTAVGERDFGVDGALLAAAGNRQTTVIGYLNTLPLAAGGATEMVHADMRIQPEVGQLLIFRNVFDQVERRSVHAHCLGTSDIAERHPGSEHAAVEVLQGEKWVFNLFFRERPLPAT